MTEPIRACSGGSPKSRFLPPAPGLVLAALLACAGALAAGCLPDDPPVRGRLLYAGVGIERPEFRYIGDEPWVMFDVRRTRPAQRLGGTTDLYMVHWETGETRLLLKSRSDRLEWQRSPDRWGGFFYMTEERITSDGPRAPVGTLVRLRLDTGEILERIPDVLSHSVHGGRTRMHYRKYLPGSNYPELHLRDIASGADRVLGVLTGQVQSQGDNLYYIVGEERALMRLTGLEGIPQMLRTRVSKFLLQDDEKRAVVTVSDANQVKTVILDLETRAERAMPIANPCCTIQLVGSTYIFADSARGDQPAELHYYDIASHTDRMLPLPNGLVDVRSMLPRPPGPRSEYLLFDSTRRTALFRTEPNFNANLTPLVPHAPGFTDDGRYLVFIDPDPAPPPPAISTLPTGRLYVQDMDNLDAPPRMLSPRGSSVPLDPVGYKLRPTEQFPLLFWARFGLGGSDLYIADYETGNSQKVATSIGAVHVSDRHVLGVVRITQDLTGDLVYRDFTIDKENIVEHGVTDVQVQPDEKRGDMVAFVVRERRPASHRNGLWATLLPAPPPRPEDTPAPAAAGETGPLMRQWLRVEGQPPAERNQ